MSLEVSVRHGFGAFALDAEFEAGPGITVLFGRSGAGKSTVVNALVGLLRPEAGRIALDGRVLLDTAARRFVPPERRRIGTVFQEARLFPHLTVRQNLRFGRWFAPRGARRADEGRIVELLGIGHLLDRRPGALSGGERQRVALGRALIAGPEALVMDEPLAALDEQRKAEIMPYIEGLRDETRLPIVYVTHSVPEVLRLASTLVLLSDGRVTRTGPAQEILADPSLFPALGRHEAGAFLSGTVTGYDADALLTTVAVAAGELRVPGEVAERGTAVRLRIRARDVILALDRPVGLSALNALPVTVEAVGEDTGGIVDVRLLAAGEPLLARITRTSLRALGIEPGRQMFAVLKSISFGRRDILC